MISKYIEHTNLKPTATENDIYKLCDEALGYGFRGVCVNPNHVVTAHAQLQGFETKVITVVGFPLGANITEIKIIEAVRAVGNGADEIDVVWDLASFKQKEYWKTLLQLTKIKDEIGKAIMKVIVEECYLTTYEEQEIAYQIVKDSGADYIKTSTGFGPSGAKLSTVNLWAGLRATQKDNLKIKAAGGISGYTKAQFFLDCGADVLGTSHGITIVNKEKV